MVSTVARLAHATNDRISATGVARRTCVGENLPPAVSDEREREISRPSLADAIDLLDLVRVAEDTARISTDSLSSSPVEDFVDVGDEAEDCAPSVLPTTIETLDPALLPPELRPKATPVKITEKVEDAPVARVAPEAEHTPHALDATADSEPAPIAVAPVVVAASAAAPHGSPISGILLVFGLVIAGLAGICALPSDPPVRPPVTKAALRAEPSNLQVERNAEEPVEGLQDDVAREPSH